jgi:hypothetical protein
MNWGHVVMSAPRLWEPDRDGPKPTCDKCKTGDHVGCRDLVDMLLGFGTMSCGCEWPWHSEGER